MKNGFLLLLVALFSLAMATTAFAGGNEPVGDCPNGFNLHMPMDHVNHSDHMHQHVGNDSDQCGDGYVCGKHVVLDGKIRVHTDNTLPLN